MNRSKMRKIAIISAISIVIIIGGGFGAYRYNKVQAYNNLITTANKCMDTSDYDKAESLFQQSLQYKNDPSIQKSIQLAKKLKEAKAVYNNGTKLMKDKKYSEAIETFKKISKDDGNLYNDSQKNIENCIKEYAAKNIELANSALKENKFDEANKYIEDILKIDVNNSEAKKLKDDVDKSIQKQKTEDEAKKNEEVRLNSQGHFVDERHYNLFLNGQTDSINLSGLDVRLSNLNGNTAIIDFVYSSRGGSTRDNGHGSATYVGNGEWRFKFQNEADFKYGIGIFRIEGVKGYINTKTEKYQIPNGFDESDGMKVENEKTFTEKDYEEVSNGKFDTVYRINN